MTTFLDIYKSAAAELGIKYAKKGSADYDKIMRLVRKRVGSIQVDRPSEEHMRAIIAKDTADLSARTHINALTGNIFYNI